MTPTRSPFSVCQWRFFISSPYLYLLYYKGNKDVRYSHNHVVIFFQKILSTGCKKGPLMQYKCMERRKKLPSRTVEIDFLSKAQWSSLQDGPERNEIKQMIMENLTPSPQSPQAPGNYGSNTNDENTDLHPHTAWARIPGRQVQGCCRESPSCSPALTPDSERPTILTGTDVHPCFCAALPAVFMQKSCEYRFLVHRHSQLFIHTGYFYFFVKA